jgi:lipoate-protein ligase A
MDTDARLLAEGAGPLIHHYDWQGKAATHGCFLDPYRYLCREAVEKEQLLLGKRPTGGGIIFHLTDLAFSIVVPASHPAYSCNTMENYAFVNRMVIQALQDFLGGGSPSLLPVEPEPMDRASRHFCMAKPTRYDVIIDGRKVGGAAQRRTKQGFLHQGSISIALPSQDLLESLLLPGSRVQEAMQINSFTLLKGEVSASALQDARETLRECLNRQVGERD